MEHKILFITDDIIYSIFMMICVKSLLRFQCVCKPWNDIICDKVFRKAHHDQSKSWNSEKSLLIQTNDGGFEFRQLENPQIVIVIQRFPLKRFQHVSALGCCDGLVLLKSQLAYKLFTLWNPYTNEYGIYECPYVKSYSCTTPHASGFCYDSDMDEYKVILIYRSFYAVFYVTTNSWKKITSVHVQELNVRSWDCSHGINIGDRVFWSIEWKIHKLVDRNSKIIYFDVKSDELKQLPKPDFIGENNQLYRLTSLKGCVGLYGGIISSKTLDVWIMEHDVWKLFMTITCSSNVLCGQFVKNTVILAEGNNDNEILFHKKEFGFQSCVIYNPERQGYRFVKQIEMPKDLRHYIVPIFSKSLYFPGKLDKSKRKRRN